LKSNPLPEGAIAEVYGGKDPGEEQRSHGQLLRLPCESGESDLGCLEPSPCDDNVSLWRILPFALASKLEWDPATQQITNDTEANTWQSREQRKGFEINVSV
jgi:hypothetical protein